MCVEFLFSGREKISSVVDFPLNDLDMSPFCEPAPATTTTRRLSRSQPEVAIEKPWYKQSSKYRLSALVTHLGRSMDEGHYITVGKCPGQGWTKYNDQQVRSFFCFFSGEQQLSDSLLQFDF
jgi:uncharacterized UBP type Zn finger protein